MAYLSSHPLISLAHKKEVHYFDIQFEYKSKNPYWYLVSFDPIVQSTRSQDRTRGRRSRKSKKGEKNKDEAEVLKGRIEEKKRENSMEKENINLDLGSKFGVPTSKRRLVRERSFDRFEKRRTWKEKASYLGDKKRQERDMNVNGPIKMRGEGSPSYLPSSNACFNMGEKYEFGGDLKMVNMFRHPIDRMWSGFHQKRRRFDMFRSRLLRELKNLINNYTSLLVGALWHQKVLLLQQKQEQDEQKDSKSNNPSTSIPFDLKRFEETIVSLKLHSSLLYNHFISSFAQLIDEKGVDGVVDDCFMFELKHKNALDLLSKHMKSNLSRKNLSNSQILQSFSNFYSTGYGINSSSSRVEKNMPSYDQEKNKKGTKGRKDFYLTVFGGIYRVNFDFDSCMSIPEELEVYFYPFHEIFIKLYGFSHYRCCMRR